MKRDRAAEAEKLLRETESSLRAMLIGAVFLQACAQNARESDDRLGPKRLAAVLMERLEHEA
jgi:protein involved in temperature-dependent protein secretion